MYNKKKKKKKKGEAISCRLIIRERKKKRLHIKNKKTVKKTFSETSSHEWKRSKKERNVFQGPENCHRVQRQVQAEKVPSGMPQVLSRGEDRQVVY